MSGVARHWRIVREAVQAERERTTGRLANVEPDFLPAVLEVIERPVSPTARITAWVLLTGFAATLAWMIFGRVDVVASAQGQLSPQDEVKLVQASTTGVVRRIYVHDGDVVRRGQPLVDLDPTISTAEETQAAKELAAAELDVARGTAIADALSGRPLAFAPPAGTPPEIAAIQRRLIAAQVAETEAASSGLAAARSSALADARSAAEQVHKYGGTVPVLDRELAAMHGLAAKGYAPGLRLLELERQRNSEAGDRAVAVAQHQRGLFDASKLQRQMVQTREQARQQALAELAKAQNEVILRREEVTKAREKNRLQRLLSPADGTVQQLDIHTRGGVVEPVKPLMVIVPEGALTMEAKVLNRDAGFVHAGQPVQVKIDAFSFTRYGSVPGRIISISRDAVEDKQIGPYYVARIALARSSIRTETGMTRLTPGLSGTADVRIGSRRIISYLTGPVREIGSEAGRER